MNLNLKVKGRQVGGAHGRLCLWNGAPLAKCQYGKHVSGTPEFFQAKSTCTPGQGISFLQIFDAHQSHRRGVCLPSSKHLIVYFLYNCDTFPQMISDRHRVLKHDIGQPLGRHHQAR